ncbi:MAG: hypothetical protein IPM24_08310 [Bryobacterales bacterium]|nr:hypothetical protein [Bryobacterales bacterium]
MRPVCTQCGEPVGEAIEVVHEGEKEVACSWQCLMVLAARHETAERLLLLEQAAAAVQVLERERPHALQRHLAAVIALLRAGA